MTDEFELEIPDVAKHPQEGWLQYAIGDPVEFDAGPAGGGWVSAVCVSGPPRRVTRQQLDAGVSPYRALEPGQVTVAGGAHGAISAISGQTLMVSVLPNDVRIAEGALLPRELKLLDHLKNASGRWTFGFSKAHCSPLKLENERRWSQLEAVPAAGQRYVTPKTTIGFMGPAKEAWDLPSGRVLKNPAPKSIVTVLEVGPDTMRATYTDSFRGNEVTETILLSSWQRALKNGLKLYVDDQQRDRGSGRYTFDGKWERPCTCGHTLGVHMAEAPHDCGECECPKFRPSRAKRGEGKPTGSCPHCGAQLRPSDVFGEGDRWFHRPCFDSGPIGKKWAAAPRRGWRHAPWDVEADTHPHTSVPEPNQQVVQRGEGAGAYYKDLAQQYGQLMPGTQTSLSHYDYRPHEQAIDDLISQNNYEVYYAGGQYGRPDLAAKNYNTGHLMVYDPTPGEGGDFDDEATTRTWRKVHELSHAMTYGALNEKYGEGRRIGKLGWQRTLREAKRAVEWEWLAVHKQRELSTQLGHPIDDATFAREVNTVMHDAVHRAVTGKFTNPDEEGFVPSDRIVPLEASLKQLEDYARSIGLQGEDDVLTPEQKRQLKVTAEDFGYDVYVPTEEHRRKVDRVVQGPSVSYVREPEMAYELARSYYDPKDNVEDWPVSEIEFYDAPDRDPAMDAVFSQEWPERTTYDSDFGLVRNKRGSSAVGRANIQKVLDAATDEERELYQDWYLVAHNQAKMIAAETHRPLDIVAAVIATLSPGMRWEANLRAARRLCMGESIAGAGGAYTVSVYKALRALKYNDPQQALTGKTRKVRPFYETLLNPVEAAKKAVVDRHMFAIWFGTSDDNEANPSDKVYSRIQADVLAVAEANDMTTQAVQAVTWALWRNREDGVRPADDPAPQTWKGRQPEPELDPLDDPPELGMEDIARVGFTGDQREWKDGSAALHSSGEHVRVIKKFERDGGLSVYLVEFTTGVRRGERIVATPSALRPVDSLWDRSANVAIADLVAEFMNGTGASFSSCATVKGAHAQCDIASQALHEFFSDRGISSQVITVRGPVTPPASGKWKGKPTEYIAHMAVKVGDTVIDLTAKQFDRTAPFPLIEPSASYFARWQHRSAQQTYVGPGPDPFELPTSQALPDQDAPAPEEPTQRDPSVVQSMKLRNQQLYERALAAGAQEVERGTAKMGEFGWVWHPHTFGSIERPDRYRAILDELERRVQRFEQRPRTAEKRTTKAEGESAVVVLRVPSALARMWPKDRGSDDDSSPHFTLCYLKGPLDPEARSKIEAVVADVAERHGPFPVELEKGVAWFTTDNPKEADKEIAHKDVHPKTAEKMAEIHWDLVGGLEAEGLKPSVRDTFKAHSTLKYCPERKYDGPIPEGGWRADTLELWGWTDDVVFRLQGK